MKDTRTITIHGQEVFVTFWTDGGDEGTRDTAPCAPNIDLISVEWNGTDVSELIGDSDMWVDIKDKLLTKLAHE